MQLVGHEHHHDVAAAGGVGDRQDLEARVLGLLHRRRVLAQADDDVDAGVLEVLGVGVALGAVADDGDGLAVEEGEVCVVVVVHGPRSLVGGLQAARGRDQRAAGKRQRPSAAAEGREPGLDALVDSSRASGVAAASAPASDGDMSNR